jgi:hypothetical protein
MSKVYLALGILGVVSFATWLFFYDAAAEPGPVSFFHESIDDCTICHKPWRGVSDERCLQCHGFKGGSNQRTEIRFHEAKTECLTCHKEHQLLGTTITAMDHRILNDDLLCSTCHFDKHEGLFGEQCRECHGIKTWKVATYKHPPEDRRRCHVCHKGPQSHYNTRFWLLIVEDMGQEDIPQEDCWRCHGIYHWGHLKMEHRIPATSDEEDALP